MNQAEFINAATVHEPKAWLHDLLPGESMEVRVIAANKAGEAATSPVATVVVL
jgi:hypothetical protein